VTKSLTSRLPAWVEDRDGKLVLVPERAEVVKLIFELTAAGYGFMALVKKLTDEGVPAFSGTWTRSNLANIVKDRRALGELQPRDAKGKPVGEPIAGYYPAVVTERVYNAARSATLARSRGVARKGGRPLGGGQPRAEGEVKVTPTREVNVYPFSGLLFNARNPGEPYYVASFRQKLLVNREGAEGRTKAYTFPYRTFEAAQLSRLDEIDPREVMDGPKGADPREGLRAELNVVRGRAEEFRAELAKGDVRVIAEELRKLEDREKDLVGRLGEADLKAAVTLTQSWGEVKSLLELVWDGDRDTRIRFRGAVRRVVEKVLLLVTHRKRDALCTAQVFYVGGDVRSYKVFHRPQVKNQIAHVPGWWSVRSVKYDSAEGKLDLRKPEDVKFLLWQMESDEHWGDVFLGRNPLPVTLPLRSPARPRKVKAQ
jgi:hypothetical protein